MDFLTESIRDFALYAFGIAAIWGGFMLVVHLG
jgi:hypothetical protein